MKDINNTTKVTFVYFILVFCV